MLVKKFFGRTTRDALRQVKAELGSEAVILSNKPLESGGIEIMAVAEGDVYHLTSVLQQQHSAAKVYNPSLNSPKHKLITSNNLNSQLPEDVEAINKQANITLMQGNLTGAYALPVEPSNVSTISPSELKAQQFFKQEEDSQAALVAQKSLTETDILQIQNSELLTMAHSQLSQISHNIEEKNDIAISKIDVLGYEVKNLKLLLQGQMASLAWAKFEEGRPVQADLFRVLLSVGISPLLCRQVVVKLPKNLNEENAVKWAKSALAHNIMVSKEANEIVVNGGLYALVGPTGVGKTTTIAKLASLCILRHGANNVALITTDSFRIGAYDQLRVYGKLMGVSVYSVQNEADLNLTLADISNKYQVILIDSVGMSQRDSRLNGQTSMLSKVCTADGRKIQRILVLACNVGGQTLEDVAKKYKGDGLAGCILSKMDEAVNIGAILDTVIRYKLSVYYITNGQKIPDDLHLPNTQFLIDRAFKSVNDSGAHSLRNEEYQIFQASYASRDE